MDEATLWETPPAPRPGEQGLWAAPAGQVYLLVAPRHDPPWWEPKPFATPAEAYAHAVGLLEASGGVEGWELCEEPEAMRKVLGYLTLRGAPEGSPFEGRWSCYAGPWGPYASTFLVEVRS